MKPFIRKKKKSAIDTFLFLFIIWY